jgi:hypothetical protein
LAFLLVVLTNFDLIDFPTHRKSELSLDFLSLSDIGVGGILPRRHLKASMWLEGDELCVLYCSLQGQRVSDYGCPQEIGLSLLGVSTETFPREWKSVLWDGTGECSGSAFLELGTRL